MKSIVLNNNQIQNKIVRFAHQILEKNSEEKKLVFVGLNERGSLLANNILKHLQPIFETTIPTFSLIAKRNEQKEIEVKVLINAESSLIKDSILLIVDDVVDSGQTLMHATSYVLNFAPKKIQTLALIDRNHRSFPIHVDFIGLKVSTTLYENVVVDFGTENQEHQATAYLV